MLLVRQLLKGMILPPLLQILLIGSALVIRKRYPRFSRCLMVLGFGSLLLFSTPWVVMQMIKWNESVPALDLEVAKTADAIVVLSGGAYYDPPEFDQHQVGTHTLVRLRYAAWLHRKLGKPILVTGGNPLGSSALADIMAHTLRDQFNVPVRWLETRSTTTWENALFTQQLLAKEGWFNGKQGAVGRVDEHRRPRILVVTQAYHMRRSVWAFEKVGFDALPAATQYQYEEKGWGQKWLMWLPSTKALAQSRQVMHEWLGRITYPLLYK